MEEQFKQLKLKLGVEDLPNKKVKRTYIKKNTTKDITKNKSISKSKNVIKMSEEDKKNWEFLFNYIKTNILEYDKTIKLPRYLVLRLKGIQKGQFICNKKTIINANYKVSDIVTCVLLLSGQLKNIINKCNDETHKVNTILYMIEKEINNVVVQIREKERAYEQLKNIDNKIIETDIGEYISKSKNNDIIL